MHGKTRHIFNTKEEATEFYTKERRSSYLFQETYPEPPRQIGDKWEVEVEFYK